MNHSAASRRLRAASSFLKCTHPKAELDKGQEAEAECDSCEAGYVTFKGVKQGTIGVEGSHGTDIFVSKVESGLVRVEDSNHASVKVRDSTCAVDFSNFPYASGVLDGSRQSSMTFQASDWSTAIISHSPNLHVAFQDSLAPSAVVNKSSYEVRFTNRCFRSKRFKTKVLHRPVLLEQE